MGKKFHDLGRSSLRYASKLKKILSVLREGTRLLDKILFTMVFKSRSG